MKLEKRQTIEHILPQGEHTLAEPYWQLHFSSPDIWRQNVHRLGNLCITEFDWNASLSNKSFPDKCGQNGAAPDERVYRNSKFQSERELAQHPDWTPQAIGDRQNTLVQFALRRWKK